MNKIKEFIIETLLYGFANVFSRFFAMLLIPLFTSYLVKDDYSNFVMLQSVFTLLTFLLALNAGVFYYYYEFENLRYRKIVFTSWFYYQLLLSLLIIILLFFLSPYLKNFFIINANNEQSIQWCLVLLGVQLLPYILNITNINFYRIDRKPKKVIIIVFLESLFTLSFVYLALKYFHFGLIGVVVAQILSRLLISLLFIKTATFYFNIKYYSHKLLKKIYVYSWPFIVSSLFFVVIVGADKFIGASALTNKDDVAILALAAQLVIPIVVLSDMIRMAIGPYIMSIRKENDANSTYQQVFDLCIFAGSLVLIGLVLISPFLTLILANQTYLKVIQIVPLLALSNVLSLAFNQFSISFNLAKKNIYILYAIVMGGIIGSIINLGFMTRFGFIVSGYSQVISYIIMSIFLFVIGRKIANLKLKIKNSSVIVLTSVCYIILIHFLENRIFKGDYILFIVLSILFGLFLLLIYFKQQQFSISQLIAVVNNKRKK